MNEMMVFAGICTLVCILSDKMIPAALIIISMLAAQVYITAIGI